MPETLLPIGHDSLGNLICLGVVGDDAGTVYFWDHEAEADEDEPPTWDNLSVIQPSFSAFLKSLERDES